MSEIAFQLHEQILILQRRMRWLRCNSQFQLDAMTSNLLPVIANRPTFYSRDLCAYLKMNPTQVSRLLTKLEEQGLIARVKTINDARLKMLELSALGRSSLAQIVSYDNALAEAGLRPLASRQVDIITTGLSVIASGLGATEDESSLEGELAFVTQQKRAARVLGMLGNNYLESGLDIATYQLCFSVLASEQHLRFRDLKDQLPFESSFISREIDRLVEKGWLKKEGRKDDARAVYVSLTARGKDNFGSIHSKTTARLRLAIGGFCNDEVKKFVEQISIANSNVLSVSLPKLKVKRCSTVRDYYIARARTVEWLVANNKHHKLSSSLISESKICYLIFLGPACVGVAELISAGGKALELKSLHTAADGAFRINVSALRESLTLIASAESAKKMKISFEVSDIYRKGLLKMGAIKSK